MSRVFMVGATGYIGAYAARELVRRGHEVVCLVRRRSGIGGRATEDSARGLLPGTELRFGDVTQPASIARDGLRGEHFDAVVSCLASRSGAPEDARSIDHRANLNVLEAAGERDVRQFVLLSAICVQRPLLAFQQAKLAFERALMSSGLVYSIVRPTAFFKSLSGQVERVKQGKPFLVFGDGELTMCKPIGERDLARYLADCLDDPQKQDAILPVGGPDDALTPKQQGQLLFDLCGKKPRFRHVPLQAMDVVIAALTTLGRVSPRLLRKAELARIGRYYASESMLVLDTVSGRYDPGGTPSFGDEKLRDHYARVLVEGLRGQELGDHAVF